MSESEDEKNYDRLESVRHGEASSAKTPELEGLLRLVELLESESVPPVMPRAHEFRLAVMSKVRRRPIWRPLCGLAASLLVVGFLSWQSRPPKVVSSTVVMDKELLENAMKKQSKQMVLEYLENSEQLLLTMRDHELMCTETSLDLQPEKDLAQKLLMQQKILSPGMEEPEFMQVRHVFHQLEQVLVDVNMMDPCTDPDEVDLINEQIVQERLLSKIRLVAQEIQYT